MDQQNIINIDDFFNFENNSTENPIPINRIAFTIGDGVNIPVTKPDIKNLNFTNSDADYKLMCMKKMQDLCMKITIDKVGNICGTLLEEGNSGKSLVIGSHTDSVFNGGQYDGSLGVYMALKAAEIYKNIKKNKQYCNLKVVIYACEESSRFKTACIGSSYLGGFIPYEKIKKLVSVDNNITYEEAVNQYKKYIHDNLDKYGIDLKNVIIDGINGNKIDKVFAGDEIIEALEAHIEQSDSLNINQKKIGIVISIGKPIRGTFHVDCEDTILASAYIVDKLNKLSLDSKKDREEETLRITVPQFDTKGEELKVIKSNEKENQILAITSKGESNHSGGTAMDSRKDAVLGLSKLIIKLNEFQKQYPELKIDFLGTKTEKWGANQIQDNAQLFINVCPYKSTNDVKTFIIQATKNEPTVFDIELREQTSVPISPYQEFFVDVRQQVPATPENTKIKLNDLINETKQELCITNSDSIYIDINSEGTPIKNSNMLIEHTKYICDRLNITYQEMNSWPGHDLACIIPNDNTNVSRLLLFIPSNNGSHNPYEKTSKENVELGNKIFTKLVLDRMLYYNKIYSLIETKQK